MIKPYVTAKKLFFIWIAIAFGLSWASAPVHASGGQTVRVAVASNFITTVNDLAAIFKAETGVDVLVSAGSTGKLYAQIKNGAPYDVFMAANAREPERLEQDGTAVAGSRFTYAEGRLALWCRNALTPNEAKDCLSTDGLRLAIANPRLAPYGSAAQEALEGLGIQTRVVKGENISQAFQLVWSGNVPVGFVALSQIQSRDEVIGAYWEVPETLHTAIEQQTVLLTKAKDKPVAKAFMSFLKSAKAREVIAAYGYSISSNMVEVR